MNKKLWITSGIIVAILTLSVFINIPKSPFWGEKIKSSLGLDLVGGTELVYEADLSQSVDKVKDMSNLSDVFRSRIDELGVAEPTIQTSGANRIIIELPGIKDIDQAINRIGQTYELVFMQEGTAEDGVQLKDFYDPTYTYPGYWKATDLTGKQLKAAEYTFQGGGNNSQQYNSEPVVTLKFDNAGKEKFATLTKDNVNKRIAIVLDGKIVSAPTVSEEIGDGSAVINGMKSLKDAQQLSKRLNEGMLPVPARLVGQQNVGATLGKDSIKNSALAGIIGLFLVALFMILCYKTSGLLATIALLIYASISLSLYKIIPVTMTLAGIAGFILSIGMAIDANILIFERMREELKAGKTVNVAITDGFKRAFSSVKDSNLSSIITCLILYYTAGSGPVRGFALTLGLGIIVSMFTAITVTRTLLLLIANSNLKRFIHV